MIKYVVYILLDGEGFDYAICDTKDLAILYSQKANKYISRLSEIKEKIPQDTFNKILNNYPELLNNKFNNFLQNNKEYTKLEIMMALDYYSMRFNNYQGIYIRKLKYFDSSNQLEYENIF